MSGPEEESVASDVKVLKAQVASIANSVESLVARQSTFEKSVSESRQFKWPVALASIMAAAVVFGAISNDASKNTQIASANLQIDLLKQWAPIAAQNANSELDRRGLHERLDKITEQLRLTDVLAAQQSEKLSEVETQFRAEDQIRNVQFASTLRFTSLLWQQSFGHPFPSEVYFPSMARQPAH